MILIAGITPKTKALDQNPRLCRSCGLSQAYLKRADSYLSLFFIPLFRVKKGTPFVQCDRCGQVSQPGVDPFYSRSQKQPDSLCKTCGRTLVRDFRFCPHCGSKV